LQKMSVLSLSKYIEGCSTNQLIPYSNKTKLAHPLVLGHYTKTPTP